MPTASASGKQQEILDVGEQLVQTRGYDGFSYRDIAEQVGIRSATIHYYYPTKADLLDAVTERYRQGFAASVAAIDSTEEHTALERVRAFCGLFQATLKADRLCLCGMLASGTATIPPTADEHARAFFAEHHAWLATTFAAGVADGSVQSLRDPGAFAAMFLAALEGGMMLARSLGRPAHLDEIVENLLELLGPTTS